MTTTNRIPCPKCSGAGIVSRFLDYKGGVCFDCGGRGSLEGQTRGGRRNMDPRNLARAIGDAVLAGQQVDETDATEAFDVFEELHPTSWTTTDYDRRNALGRLIGRVLA